MPVAAKDSLHQQYRLPLIEGGEAVFALADGLGALATFISGAGPTIPFRCAHGRSERVFERAQAALESDEELAHFTLHRFVADNEGGKGRLNGPRRQNEKQERVCRAPAFDRGIGENRYGTHRTKIRRQLRRGPRPHF